jgi:hypothetical protein
MAKRARRSRIARGGTRGTLFLSVARMRLDDGTALISAKRYNCAMYIVGYAIECALKWAIAERYGETHLPAALEHHRWDELLDTSGLRTSLTTNPVLSAIYSSLADSWHPSMRYMQQIYTRNEAEFLHRQYREMFNWIVESAL